MNTAVINIKTNIVVKKKAQKVASKLGFSLSSLINGYLNQLIRTKTVHFSSIEETPSEYMIQAPREAEEDRRKGRVSPSFDNAKDAVNWLNDPGRKYMNES